MEVKPEYKRTEVGVIPEEWKVEQLGRLADFVTSGSRGWAQFYADTGALFIRSQNVRDGRLSFDEVQYVSPPSGAEGNRTKAMLNDLLITITGNSVGNVAMVDQVFDKAYISQHVGLVRLKEPDTADYICRYLSPNSPGNPQIAGSQSGQSKPGLNLQDLRDFRIALPTTDEELQAIVEVLSDVDALMNALDRLIAKKRDLKRAAMKQLLTGNIRLPGFLGKWEVQALADVADVTKGTQLQSSETDNEGQFPHFNGGISPSSYTDKSNTAAHTIAISEGGNSCGYVQFISERFWCGGHCYTIVPKGVDNRFLYHMLKAQQTAIMGLRVGSGLPNVQKTSLKAFKLNLPLDPDEQAGIAEVLSDMDAELTAIEAQRDKTSNLKLAMIQELLTGKTRLM
ncbi:MAG TPA: restriction endonuclease subunit S [Armatimonadota bacterium]|nr:restriction endonuclease subunit S [Armatimonadota bacterium]